MPKVPLNTLGHDELRKHVCIVCMRKADYNITDLVLGRICQFFVSNLDLTDARLPKGICNSCRKALQKLSEGNYGQELPDVFDFSAIKLKRMTKSSFACDCLICAIATSRLSSDHPLGLNVREKGRPVTQVPGNASFSFAQAPPTPVKICLSCLSLPKVGHPHQCNISTRRENLLALAASDPQGAEMIASKVVSESPSSPGGTVRLAQRLGGRPLPLTRGASHKPPERHASFSVEDLIHIQLCTGLSKYKMEKLATTVRRHLGRKSVQRNFQAEFANFDSDIKDEFIAGEIEVGREKIHVAHCKDFNDLVGKVLSKRELNPHETMSKLAIDGGQTFLKVVAFFINLDSDPSDSAGSSSMTSARFKDSGPGKRKLYPFFT